MITSNGKGPREVRTVMRVRAMFLLTASLLAATLSLALPTLDIEITTTEESVPVPSPVRGDHSQSAR